jgi:phospholipid/cholesterol/gamma-HCH transport system substrate-binding protein
MKKSAMYEVIVGLVFVLGVALLGTYTILQSKGLRGETKKYIVDFEQVWGLKEGDAVRVEGHEKGEVKSLRLMPPAGGEKGKVRAVIEVEGDVVIYRDQSSVRVTPFSPLGGRVIEIARGKESPRGTYDYFGDAEGAKAQEEVMPIDGQAEGELLQTLNRLVEENQASVKNIVNNLETVSRQLTRTDSVLGLLINDPSAAKDVDGVIASLSSSANRVERILARVEQGDGVIGGLLKKGSPLEGDVSGTVVAARHTFESGASILERANAGKSPLGVLVGDEPVAAGHVQGIVADVSEITSRISAGTGTLGKLVHDDRLYEGASRTAENLGAITDDVRAGHGLLGMLTEEESGKNGRETLRHLASISSAVDDPRGGTVGMLVHDDALRARLGRISTDVERLVVEFRDSLEDTREQAPVNAFIGAVFAAF